MYQRDQHNRGRRAPLGRTAEGGARGQDDEGWARLGAVAGRVAAACGVGRRAPLATTLARGRPSARADLGTGPGRLDEAPVDRPRRHGATSARRATGRSGRSPRSGDPGTASDHRRAPNHGTQTGGAK